MENEETVDKHPFSKRKFDCVVRFSEHQKKKEKIFNLTYLLDDGLNPNKKYSSIQ